MMSGAGDLTAAGWALPGDAASRFGVLQLRQCDAAPGLIVSQATQVHGRAIPIIFCQPGTQKCFLKCFLD